MKRFAVAVIVSIPVLSLGACGDLENILGSTITCCCQKLGGGAYLKEVEGTVCDASETEVCQIESAYTHTPCDAQDRAASAGRSFFFEEAVRSSRHEARTKLLAKLASIEPFQPAHSGSTQGDERLECRAECEAGSPLCLSETIDGSSQREVVNISSLLLRDRIRMSDLLDALGEEEDPCQRGDIVLAGGGLVTEGPGCSISLGRSSAFDIEAFLFVPERMEARYLVSRGKEGEAPNAFELHFDEPAAAPAITIYYADVRPLTRAEMDRDFGGRVRVMTADSVGLALETENGCLVANFK